MNNLIAFEGVDCSGKSTQIRLLENKLSKDNVSYSIYREPGGNPLSEKIRDILLDKSINIGNKAETMLFLAARAQLIVENIIPDLEQNKLVICDRFCDSTLVYQGYGKKIDKELIKKCNFFVTQDLKPKITIIMDIDYENSLLRMGKSKDRMEDNSRIFFEDVINGYRELSLESPDKYFVIDANLSQEEIHDLIWKKIKIEFKI